MAFVSEALTPASDLHDAAGPSFGEPAFPGSFRRRDEVLQVAAVRCTWYEVDLGDARRAVICFDRGAKHRAARWRLNTIEAES
jgi:hypothetical protein